MGDSDNPNNIAEPTLDAGKSTIAFSSCRAPAVFDSNLSSRSPATLIASSQSAQDLLSISTPLASGAHAPASSSLGRVPTVSSHMLSKSSSGCSLAADRERSPQTLRFQTASKISFTVGDELEPLPKTTVSLSQTPQPPSIHVSPALEGHPSSSSRNSDMEIDILRSKSSSPVLNAETSTAHLDLSEEALLASDPESHNASRRSSLASRPMECSPTPSFTLSPANTSASFLKPVLSASGGLSMSEVVDRLTPCEPSSSRRHDPSPDPTPTSDSPGGQRAPRSRRGITKKGRGAATRDRKGSAKKSVSKRPGDVPQRTPPGYRSYLTGLHPWADLVIPRPRRLLCDESLQVDINLSVDKYLQTPNSGYLSQKFARTLFPRTPLETDVPVKPLPFIELQHIEDAVAFRRRSAQIISQVLARTYTEADTGALERLPFGRHPAVLSPPRWHDRRPVLYQVVSTGWGSGVILEAKDFFVIGPDRRDLHCIILDHYAINLPSGLRGFDKRMVSVRDFVWIYDVKPSIQALQNPDAALIQSREPRSAPLESTSVYFFRASAFAFVTPHPQEESIYGTVLSTLVRRDRIQSFRATFEGAPDPVVVSPSACRFGMESAREYQMLMADSRYNVSGAIRFSEPPVSVEARDRLCRLIRQFQPMLPDEGLLPLTTYYPPPHEEQWLVDRAGRFEAYHDDTPNSRHKMSKLFNAACSALAGINFILDDRLSHWVTAAVTNMEAYPLTLEFQLEDMACEAGWVMHRPISLWICGSPSVVHAKVRSVEARSELKQLIVSVIAFPWSHGSIVNNIQQFGRQLPGVTFVDARVRLGRPLATSNPAYETVSRMNIYDELVHNTAAQRLVDTLYGRATFTCASSTDPPLFGPVEEGWSCVLNGRRVDLTEDQHKALELALSSLPVVAIQAAYGTGKTVVGALAAALLARDTPVIVTASTNAAVAQFAETLMALSGQEHLVAIRYVADTAAAENNTRTPIDLGMILKGLGAHLGELMTEEERHLCSSFQAGRELIERYIADPNLILHMSAEEREEYIISEKFVSRNLKKMVNLMFRLLKPNVILATTSSVLNISGKGGIFRKYMATFKVMIGDEASQIPEPVVAALAVRLPAVRHVYIGDVHQLEPHAKCPRSSSPARFGARSIMSILTAARAVPVAPLVTTFRSHPDLVELPNRVAYNGELRSGVPREARQMLFRAMSFPNPLIPFMFIDIQSTATRAASRSWFNETEANACWALIDRLNKRGIPNENICIITFYREQYRRLHSRAAQLGADIATVDAVQGREKEVVIILTTRTNIDFNSADFLDDYRRMNVAITRCRQGQFVLGHAQMLTRIPHWRRVIAWATEIGAMVNCNDLDRYL